MKTKTVSVSLKSRNFVIRKAEMNFLRHHPHKSKLDGLIVTARGTFTFYRFFFKLYSYYSRLPH